MKRSYDEVNNEMVTERKSRSKEMISRNQAITLTFGDRAENHRGMQIIGDEASCGFTYDNLRVTKEFFEVNLGCEGCRIYSLHEMAIMMKDKEKPKSDLAPAYLLVIPNAIQKIGDYEKLKEEMLNIAWDEKAFMYGRVVNKKARHNVCFDSIHQDADYEKGLGTIIAYEEVKELERIRDQLIDIVPNSGDLKVEGNFYYDVRQCGIGYHGDSERKKVIGIRLGEKFPLCYQWFLEGSPVSERIEFTLGDGDLYVMSEKAVGFDWKRKLVATLRHAAGCTKFIEYKKSKK